MVIHKSQKDQAASSEKSTIWLKNTTHPDLSDGHKVQTGEFCGFGTSSVNTSVGEDSLHRSYECTESGSVIDNFFKFLLRNFSISDCGKRTSVQHKSEELYYTMLQSHCACLTTSRVRQEEEEATTTTTQDNISASENFTRQALASLPSLTQVKSAIEYLCSHVRRNFNRKCALEQLARVESCIEYDVHTIAETEGHTWRYGTIDPCRHLQVTAVCTYETIEEACSDREAAVMAGAVGHYLRSPHCSLSRGESLNARAWGLGSVLIMAILIVEIVRYSNAY